MTNYESDLKNVLKLREITKALLKEKRVTRGLKKALHYLLKEISLYGNHIKGRKKWEDRKKSYDFRRIQIGGGEHALKGFFNIDIVPPAGLICDVREGLSLNSECVEFIFSEHFLEHIDYPVSVKKFIKECYRILKPGGRIVIGVPDSKLAVKSYYLRDSNFYKQILKRWYSKRNFLTHVNTYIDLLNYHFRDQNDNQKYNPHLWAYDYEKLISLLSNASFSGVKKWRFDKKIGNPKRKFGSIYVTAIK